MGGGPLGGAGWDHVVDQHPGSGVGEGPGYPGADVLAGTGDERRTPCEVEHLTKVGVVARS